MKSKKVKKKLAQRIAAYQSIVSRLRPEQAKGYKKPGSFKK